MWCPRRAHGLPPRWIRRHLAIARLSATISRTLTALSPFHLASQAPMHVVVFSWTGVLMGHKTRGLSSNIPCNNVKMGIENICLDETLPIHCHVHSVEQSDSLAVVEWPPVTAAV